MFTINIKTTEKLCNRMQVPTQGLLLIELNIKCLCSIAANDERYDGQNSTLGVCRVSGTA